MAGTQSIGALIVELRANSAQFSAEMDKARKSVKDVGGHAAISTRQLARFGAIAAEQVVPGLQGSRQAVEGLVQALASARGGFALLGPVAAAFGSALAGFALGNVIRNFQDLREAGFGYVESLKLAIGSTKSYEEVTKDALEAQKKFSAEQQKSRDIVIGLTKELATLRGDQETLLRLAETERRTRVQGLSGEARARAQAIADEAALEQRRQKALEREDAILKTMKEQREERGKEATGGAEAAGALGLKPSGLILGLKEIDKFKSDVAALGLEIRNLAKDGVPARDIFTQIAESQEKVDEQIAALKVKFADVPTVFNRLVEIERQIGAGGLTKSLDATVKSIQKLGEGSARVEDETGNLLTTLGRTRQEFGVAGEAANFFAGVMFEDIPSASNAAAQSFVTVTGQLDLLAIAFARAREQAVLFETVVGTGGNVAVAAPGNF